MVTDTNKKKLSHRPILATPLVFQQPTDLLSDISTSEEAYGKLMALLADETKRNMISDLTGQEIIHVAALAAVADQYDIKLLKEYLKNFLLLRISKDRQGRKEIAALAGQKIQEAQNLRQKFAGLFRRDSGI